MFANVLFFIRKTGFKRHLWVSLDNFLEIWHIWPLGKQHIFRLFHYRSLAIDSVPFQQDLKPFFCWDEILKWRFTAAVMAIWEKMEV